MTKHAWLLVLVCAAATAVAGEPTTPTPAPTPPRQSVLPYDDALYGDDLKSASAMIEQLNAFLDTLATGRSTARIALAPVVLSLQDKKRVFAQLTVPTGFEEAQKHGIEAMGFYIDELRDFMSKGYAVSALRKQGDEALGVFYQWFNDAVEARRGIPAPVSTHGPPPRRQKSPPHN